MPHNDPNPLLDTNDRRQADLEQHISETKARSSSEEQTQMRPLQDLMERLNIRGRQTLAIALGESLRIGHFWLGLEFLLMGLSKQRGQAFPMLLGEMKIHPGQFRGMMRGIVDVAAGKNWRARNVLSLGAEALFRLQVAEPDQLRRSFQAKQEQPLVLTPRMFAILKAAAKLSGEGLIGHNQLLGATFQYPHALAMQIFFRVANQVGWSSERLVSRLSVLIKVKPEDLLIETPKPAEKVPPPQQIFSPTQQFRRGKPILTTFGRDLTQLAQDRKLHQVEGEIARKAIARIGKILLQGEAHNPMLIGDPGVGKTAIVEGFAWILAGFGEEAVKQLAGRRVIELSAKLLMAGATYRSDQEGRLQQLLHEVNMAEGQIIVFINEIHSILGDGVASELSSIAHAIKSALARGEFPCIGATTVAKYHKYIEKDAALAQHFTPVWVEEPDIEEAIRILQKVVESHLKEHREIMVIPEAVDAAVKLSARHLRDQRLPGKAIKVLDQACSGLIFGESLSGLPEDKFQTMTAKIVTKDVIRELIAEQTNIPI